MRGETSWSYRPYRPPLIDVGDIYICRVAPKGTEVEIEWLPLDGVSAYTVRYGLRGESEREILTVSGTSVKLSGLCDECDYEVTVEAGNLHSRTRLFRTGFVPGDSVINYLHPDDEAYAFSGRALCSPSMVRHPDGYLLASMDVFRGDGPQDLTLIFRSDDDGKSWHYVSELFPCFWGKMFLHRGSLYMLACNTEYGDLLIGRSDDGGRTFTKPVTLLRGSCGHKQPGVHKNPQPVVEYKGRLWETLEWGSWAEGYHAAMCMSVPVDADLLDPSAWAFTYPIPYDASWEGAVKGGNPCCIEGCMTVAPDGELYNVMRYCIGGDCTPSYGRAVVMKPDIEHPEAPLAFDRVIDFPGNHVKFEIRYDETSRRYWSIVCYLCPGHTTGRNLLALISSEDMWNWKLERILLDYRDCPEAVVGFQYVDFIIEGADIIYQCRTAFNCPINFHDANYSTFHRIRDFRG